MAGKAVLVAKRVLDDALMTVTSITSDDVVLNMMVSAIGLAATEWASVRQFTVRC